MEKLNVLKLAEIHSRTEIYTYSSFGFFPFEMKLALFVGLRVCKIHFKILSAFLFCPLQN